MIIYAMHAVIEKYLRKDDAQKLIQHTAKKTLQQKVEE